MQTPTISGHSHDSIDVPGRPAAALQVSVAFHSVEHRGGMSFATYEVTSTEDGQVWRQAIRWSDLRGMHEDLMRWHGDEMQSARRTFREVHARSLPSFRAHGGIGGVLRTGAAKLAPSYCTARAVEMQELLGALVLALGVSLVRQEGPLPLRNFLTKGCDVEQRTPEANWYTPERGWPAHVVAWAGEARLAPCELTHTGPAAAALPEEVLGELRVEVLQATGLAAADLLSSAAGSARTEDGQAASAASAPNASGPRPGTTGTMTCTRCCSSRGPARGRRCSRTRATRAGSRTTAAPRASLSPRRTRRCTWASSAS